MSLSSQLPKRDPSLAVYLYGLTVRSCCLWNCAYVFKAVRFS